MNDPQLFLSFMPMHLIPKHLDVRPIQGSPGGIDAITRANTTTASERLSMHCSMRTRRVTARAWSYSDLCADYLQACRWLPMPMIKPTLKLPRYWTTRPRGPAPAPAPACALLVCIAGHRPPSQSTYPCSKVGK